MHCGYLICLKPGLGKDAIGYLHPEKDTGAQGGPDSGQGKVAGKSYGWDQTQNGVNPQAVMLSCLLNTKFLHLGCEFRPSELKNPEGTPSYPEEGL